MNSKPQFYDAHPATRYSVEQLQQAVTAYGDRFNDPVPLDLLAGAANRFRSSELMATLLDCINNQAPIGNWQEFAVHFLSEPE